MPEIAVRRRTVRAGGVDLDVVEAGSAEGPVVVLAHGFPELAFSWRHQVPALAAAGYRVLAPDQRGYGRSGRPDDIGDYDIAHLTGDLVALIDDVGAEKATIVGHDWGAIITWQMPLLHPDRVQAVAGVSVPFVPRGPVPPTQAMRAVLGDAFFYMTYFQEPGVADADLGADAATTMRRMLGAGALRDGETVDPSVFAADGRGFVDRMPEPASLPDWLTPGEFDTFVTEFGRTGFTGGLNWYRNLDRNWELTAPLHDARIEVPSLFLTGRLDPVQLMMPPANAHPFLTDHRGDVFVEGAGHWVMQEKPDEVNAALVAFLDDVNRAPG